MSNYRAGWAVHLGYLRNGSNAASPSNKRTNTVSRSCYERSKGPPLEALLVDPDHDCYRRHTGFTVQSVFAKGTLRSSHGKMRPDYSLARYRGQPQFLHTARHCYGPAAALGPPFPAHVPD